MFRSLTWTLAVAVLASLVTFPALAADATTYEIGEGAYVLPIPAGWNRTMPRSRIVEHEFEIKPLKEGDAAGRATVMAAGGSVEDNINRWIQQFVQPDGSETSEKAKVTKATIAGQEVHLVDITGTYMDKPGPFVPGPGTPRPNYRMLGAIIQTQRAGNYFVKFYGPAEMVAKNEAGFKTMLDGLKAQPKK